MNCLLTYFLWNSEPLKCQAKFAVDDILFFFFCFFFFCNFLFFKQNNLDILYKSSAWQMIYMRASLARLDSRCGFDHDRIGNILSRRLIMKYFLWSFSPPSVDSRRAVVSFLRKNVVNWPCWTRPYWVDWAVKKKNKKKKKKKTTKKHNTNKDDIHECLDLFTFEK